MVLHKADCANFMRVKNKNVQWLGVDWQAKEGEEFEVKVLIDVDNQRGALASIANTMSKLGINIEHIEISEKDSYLKSLNLVISVTNTEQLADISKHLMQLDLVQSVKRF